MLPQEVGGVVGSLESGVTLLGVATKDGDGLIPSAMPRVTITKYSRYAVAEPGGEPCIDDEVEILARIRANLAAAPLAGFVCEGMSPFGMADPMKNSALSVAIFAGMPVVRTGRGNAGGMAYRTDPTSSSATTSPRPRRVCC